MERAASFTAVSGWGQVSVGVIGLAAAVLAGRAPTEEAAVHVWLAAAAISLVVAVGAMWTKARATGTLLFSGPGRKFVWSFSPPLAAGLLLTVALYGSGLYDWLPGVWLLLFGTAVVTGGAQSVKVVPVMGLAFMALGAVALWAPAAAGLYLMAVGFGLLNVVFGVIIALKYGG